MEHKRERFLDALQDCPVIAALKSDEGLEKAIASDCTTVFFLYGTILNIASHVERVKQAGKIVFVHADLIEGLTARDITADFIAQTTQADGIISTRPNIIRRAKALGMLTIQRFSCSTRSRLILCCAKARTRTRSICSRAPCRACSSG